MIFPNSHRVKFSSASSDSVAISFADIEQTADGWNVIVRQSKDVFFMSERDEVEVTEGDNAGLSLVIRYVDRSDRNIVFDCVVKA